ncbi:unnamed protein product, partial [Oppiella nova]
MDEAYNSLVFAPWIGTAIAVGYAVYLKLKTPDHKVSADVKPCVNPGIKKETDRVVDVIDIENLGPKAAFCRCWRSKKFPYCDGAHTLYNKH